MDASPYKATPPSVTFEQPELPEGWRSAEGADWEDPYLAARKRARLVRVAAVLLVVAVVVGVFVWIAATNYARGVAALEAHSYARAVSEFSVAKVIVFPYRDAQRLEAQARRLLAAEDAVRARTKGRLAAVNAQLAVAGTRLEAGDADGVLATLQAISPDDLQATLGSDQTATASAVALSKDIAAAANVALLRARWVRAGRFAAALLVLGTSNQQAAALGARARVVEGLSAKLGNAKSAARRGQWRQALRLAREVLAAQKGFPGAAGLVADARVALAPKPKHVVTPPAPAVATAAAPPVATGSAATPTPPQPPPP